MNPNLAKSNNQEILVTTIHNQENVTEVYLNEKMRLVTELVHKSNNSACIYQHTLELYLKQHENFNGVEEKIMSLLEV